MRSRQAAIIPLALVLTVIAMLVIASVGSQFSM